MAEIKSTIDLVMEKVGKIEISSEEKDRFKKEEVKVLAQQLLSRYSTHGDQRYLPTLKKELQYAQLEVKEAIAELLVATYSFENPSPETLTILDLVQGDKAKAREILEALQGLTSDYQRERDEEWRRREEDLRAELARKGVSGSAVEPNPASNPAWTEFIEQLNKKYEEHKRELSSKFI